MNIKFINNIINKIKSKKYGIPYNIDKFWPYYHESLTKEMKKLGFELGTVPSRSNRGDFACMLQNREYEYIYVITKMHRLKGGDFIGGTDFEFDLTFHKRIKRRYAK